MAWESASKSQCLSHWQTRLMPLEQWLKLALGSCRERTSHSTPGIFFICCGLSLWCLIFKLYVKMLASYNVVNYCELYSVQQKPVSGTSGPCLCTYLAVCCAGRWVPSTEQVEMPISLVQRSATCRRSGQTTLSQSPAVNQSHAQTEDR